MKKIKGLLLIIICLFVINGCVKSNTTMTINSDKSMTFEVETMISDEVNDYGSNVIDINNLERLGFKVTTITDNGYKGYKITKSFSNIDELSNNNGEEVIISDIFNDNFNASVLFSINRSFIKNTYTANYKYIIDDKFRNTSETEEETNEELNGEVELLFTVNLPSSSVSNNANTKTNNDKTLTWNLNQNEISFINYSFEMYNKMNLIILGSGVFGFLIILIVIIIIIKKKKSSKETLIHKEYDPSIANYVEPSMKVEDFITPDESTTEKKDIKEVVKELPKPEEKKEEELFNLYNELLVNKVPNLEIEEPKQEVKMVEEERQNMFIQNNTNTNEQSTPNNVIPPSVDYHSRPDFIKDDGPKTFVIEEDKPKETPVIKQEVELDVPDGIALSDMGNIKK